MKVLVVMDSLFTGGAEYSTLLWMEWMEAHGYDVKLVLLKPKNPSYKIEHFKVNPERVSQLVPGSGYQRYKQLQKIIDTFQPEIVHSVLTASNFLCRTLRLTGSRFVHVESLVNQPYSAERLSDASLSRWKIKAFQLFDRMTQKKGVQHFHANSKAVAAHYMQAVSVPEQKLTVVPRGRQENPWILQKKELRNKYNEEFAIPSDHVLLINTGRHEHQKGHDVLLKAVALSKSDIPFTVLIAGREGAFTNSIFELLEQLGLKEKVQLIGHRTDIPQLLAAADLFVFPSRFEGMPGALIEACAAGLAIVCTDLPCMTEVVTENKNALLFPTEDPQALATQLDQLLMDADKRNEMGAESLVIFRNNFQLEHIHLSLEKLYQQQFA